MKSGFLAKLLRKRDKPEGTASYMSPEQIKCELLDARSDVYSFGCTMYEVVTFRPPFRGNSVSDLFRKHLTEKASPPSVYNPDISDEFGAIVVKMLAKNPADRYKNLLEAMMDLRKIKSVFKSRQDPEEDNHGM